MKRHCSASFRAAKALPDPTASAEQAERFHGTDLASLSPEKAELEVCLIRNYLNAATRQELRKVIGWSAPGNPVLAGDWARQRLAALTSLLAGFGWQMPCGSRVSAHGGDL